MNSKVFTRATVCLLEFFCKFFNTPFLHFANHSRFDVLYYSAGGGKIEVNQSMTTKNLKNVSFYDNLQALENFYGSFFYILLILYVCYKVEQKFFFFFKELTSTK